MKRTSLIAVYVVFCTGLASAIQYVLPRDVLPDDIANSAGLAQGGQFMDYILPLPSAGLVSEGIWGATNSLPRDPTLGIEDNKWSYWGGNPIKGDDGLYHCFVARWVEDNPRGHKMWPKSEVAHATASDPIGPWTMHGPAYPYLDSGLGHNPEVQRLSDDRWGLWLNGGKRRITEGRDINGKWLDVAKAAHVAGTHSIAKMGANPAVSVRKDGSIFFCSRTGCLGIAPDGKISSPLEGIRPKTFPFYGGGPEDPAFWKTGHQYYIMYNYWQVRLAIVLRSHDGLHWETDPGIAYDRFVEKYDDGTVVDWFKGERPKVVQDEHGRVTHLALAFIDVLKNDDKGGDSHSSKHITLPLVVEGLTSIEADKRISRDTRRVAVRLIAEDGFNPLTDIDVDRLRFGDPKEVNYGRGIPAAESHADSKDLLVVFEGAAHGIDESSFTAKIIGKRNDGSLYYAYPKLPGFYDDPPMLVVMPIEAENGNYTLRIKNYGLVDSNATTLTLKCNGEAISIVNVPALKTYEDFTHVGRAKGPFKVKDLTYEWPTRYQTEWE